MQDNQRQATLLAYLAGIIDGEGTIRIAKGKPINKQFSTTRYAAHISVGMSDKNVLDLFAKTFGHNTTVRKECVPNRKIMYRWGTSGSKGVPKILKKLLPYLIVKKKNAELVLQLCENFASWRKKKTCVKCGKSQKIQGYSLCHKCYQQEYRKNTLINWKKKHKNPSLLSKEELQRREELYLKVKKLNAVGAAATTNQKDTRESEVIV